MTESWSRRFYLFDAGKYKLGSANKETKCGC